MMRRMAWLLLWGCLTLLTACDMETSQNGDLDGLWVLQRVDTLATGQMTDMRERLVTWSVQMHLLQVRDPQQPYWLIAHFEHQNQWLVVRDLHYDSREDSDIPIDDVQQLETFGLSAMEERFLVVQLNGSSMVLESSRLRLHFRKY